MFRHFCLYPNSGSYYWTRVLAIYRCLAILILGEKYKTFYRINQQCQTCFWRIRVINLPFNGRFTKGNRFIFNKEVKRHSHNNLGKAANQKTITSSQEIRQIEAEQSFSSV